MKFTIAKPMLENAVSSLQPFLEKKMQVQLHHIFI